MTTLYYSLMYPAGRRIAPALANQQHDAALSFRFDITHALAGQARGALHARHGRARPDAQQQRAAVGRSRTSGCCSRPRPRRTSDAGARVPRRGRDDRAGARALATNASASHRRACTSSSTRRIRWRELERRFVADAFLKKRTRWDDDSRDPARRSRPAQLRARRVLARGARARRRRRCGGTGRSRCSRDAACRRPRSRTTPTSCKWVAEHPGGIGYVAGGTGLAGVKTVEVE